MELGNMQGREEPEYQKALLFVRTYVSARRTAKPSLRQLHEAVMYLSKVHDQKLPDIVRALKDSGHRGNFASVVRRAWELKYLVAKGWTLHACAEDAGKMVSFGWLHSISLTTRDIQERDIASKASKLGIKL